MQTHGEYKMPGGKLVVADLVIDAGRLGAVAISGDFFLEPESALEAINAALTGLPADADAVVLAAAVQRGLPDGAMLYGISAEAVAVAVRRAVEAGASA
ncbi:MAG: biotin--protein ligase [Xanthomonadaceae bacterium]|nr:biotin--protein ligase [Xanthomonadaceae bacterium]